MFYKKGKKAFTLAEVLIVLGIIGIIAEMTIPTLIQSSKKQELGSLFKKEFSQLSNAWSQVITDNGGSIVGIFPTSDAALDALCTKLKCIKKCYLADDPTQCSVPYAKAKSLDGVSTWAMTANGSMAVLADGTVFGITGSIWDPNCKYGRYKNTTCSALSFDTTGLKGPNTVGRDIFELWINQNNIVPTGAAGESLGEAFAGDQTGDCNPSVTTYAYNGAACGARILTEGGMKY